VNASEYLATLRAELDTALRAESGRVFLALDPLHALEILVSSPAAYFAVLLDKGEALYGSGAVRPLQVTAGIYVAQNRGLAADPGAAIVPLVARCEALRDRIMGIVFPENETASRYGGRLPVSLPDGMPLAAYELTFTHLCSGKATSTEA
jgi:hypothetical protein